jgi:tripartite-type tricarboxylate transporter receptor subunit TctC
MSKRIFITLALIAAAAFAAPAARADDAYPTRTMHIVVPTSSAKPGTSRQSSRIFRAAR